MDALSLSSRAIRDRGWDRKPTGRMLAELAAHVAIALSGLAIAVTANGVLARVCGLVLSTFGAMGVAANTHTSSHYATSERRWLNELLTYVGCPLFLGFSATYWWHKHMRHHPAPNVVGLDDDVTFWPLFALTDDEVERSSGLRRLYYTRLQWLVLPVALAGLGFSMQGNGWAHLFSTLRTRSWRRGHTIDVAMLLLHFATALALPMLLISPAQAMALYVARFALFGYAMFIVFGPAHLPAEAVCTTQEVCPTDRLSRHTTATLNFHTGTLGGFVCSGLQYQIEHHLFPNVSPVHYPAISRVVEEVCRRQGQPYRRYGWGEGIWKSFLAFRIPKPVDRGSAPWRGASAATVR